MKWESYGLIFKTADYGIDFAKSPQAIVLKDCIRIYFSACRQDNSKLISYVCFVDFDKSFTRILRFSDAVLPAGKLGCFDEHGIFPFSPVQVGDRIYAYTTGWSRRSSVSVETGIGLAISKDQGETFSKQGDGPVLTASLHEPFLVADGYVKKVGGFFYMWYIYGTDWKVFEPDKEPDRVYKIGCATSGDGVQWEKGGRQIVPDLIEDESQALPSILSCKNQHHMIFCYRNSYDFRTNPERSYRLGYAYSNDLENWVRKDSELGFVLSKDGFDNEMQCYPCWVSVGEKNYLLYNGNRFGKAGFGLAELKEM